MHRKVSLLARFWYNKQAGILIDHSKTEKIYTWQKKDSQINMFCGHYTSFNALFLQGFAVKPHLHSLPQVTPSALQGQPQFDPLVLFVEHVLLHEHETRVSYDEYYIWFKL